jgi:hypothetical protein
MHRSASSRNRSVSVYDSISTAVVAVNSFSANASALPSHSNVLLQELITAKHDLKALSRSFLSLETQLSGNEKRSAEAKQEHLDDQKKLISERKSLARDVVLMAAAQTALLKTISSEIQALQAHWQKEIASKLQELEVSRHGLLSLRREHDQTELLMLRSEAERRRERQKDAVIIVTLEGEARETALQLLAANEREIAFNLKLDSLSEQTSNAIQIYEEQIRMLRTDEDETAKKLTDTFSENERLRIDLNESQRSLVRAEADLRYSAELAMKAVSERMSMNAQLQEIQSKITPTGNNDGMFQCGRIFRPASRTKSKEFHASSKDIMLVDAACWGIPNPAVSVEQIPSSKKQALNTFDGKNFVAVELPEIHVHTAGDLEATTPARTTGAGIEGCSIPRKIAQNRSNSQFNLRDIDSEPVQKEPGAFNKAVIYPDIKQPSNPAHSESLAMAPRKPNRRPVRKLSCARPAQRQVARQGKRQKNCPRSPLRVPESVEDDDDDWVVDDAILSAKKEAN